jgi:glyoxylate reductase
VSAARIVVTRPLVAGLEPLAAAGAVWVNPEDRPLAPDELAARAAGADALLAVGDGLDADFFAGPGAGLQIVANFGAGHDNLDVVAAAAHGVVVTNTPDVVTNATADLAFALLLALARRLREAEAVVRGDEPWRWSPLALVGDDLAGATLGVVGLGGIGRAVARRARGFGMRIVASGRPGRPPAPDPELAIAPATLDELLAAADVVTLHAPLTPETRHLIDARALQRMKRSALLVNTARGALVDEAALADALRRGEIAGAGLDVFEHEPRVHPGLREAPNVVLTPHIGSATAGARRAMAALAARNIAAVLRGEPPLTPVRA